MIDRHDRYSALDKYAADIPRLRWGFLLPAYDVCNIGELGYLKHIYILSDFQKVWKVDL